MLVLENVDAYMVDNQLMMSVFDAKAMQHLPAGHTLGERHVLDSDEGPTKSIVWEVNTPA